MPEQDAKKIERELDSVSAGAAPTPQTGPDAPGGGGSGGEGQDPSWQQPQTIDAADYQAGAVQPQDLGDSAPTPPVPGDPSIRVKVQDADLTGNPDNAAG